MSDVSVQQLLDEGWVPDGHLKRPHSLDEDECWCNPAAGRAVQDDGLDVETLRRALNDYDAFVGFREDDGRDVTVKDRHEWAERWVNRLRAAPPLHDPTGPAEQPQKDPGPIPSEATEMRRHLETLRAAPPLHDPTGDLAGGANNGPTWHNEPRDGWKP